jgi:muramoyltetrapeptide carboxypeptidase
MKTPTALKKGDIIGIVCTARKIDMKDLQPAIDIIDSWGFRVVLGKSVFMEDHQFAGDDNTRAEDFQNMLDNKNVRAIIIARGGYGTVRMIDKLDFKKIKKNPKWIIGYSDITVLHNHINRHCKTETLHASMPINFSTNEPAALQSLRDVLQGNTLSYSFQSNFENKPGKAKGKLTGGNLSVLYSLSGTDSDVDTDGKILFLEDLDEYLYHIDRMLMQLKRNGKLKNLKGLLVGGFTDMKDNTVTYGKTAYEIIYEHVKEYNYPVAFNIPAGHIPNNHALIMGRKVKIEVSKTECAMAFDSKPLFHF